MSIAIVQTNQKVRSVGVGLNQVVSDSITVTGGNLLVACVSAINGTATIAVSDTRNAAYAKDKASTPNANVEWQCEIWSFPNAAAGATVVTATLGVDCTGYLTLYELSGAATASAVDGTPITANPTGSPSASYTTTAADSCIIAAMNQYNAAWTITAGTNFTMLTMQTDAASGSNHAAESWLDVVAAGTNTVAFTVAGGITGPYSTMAAVAYKAGATTAPLGMFGGN